MTGLVFVDTNVFVYRHDSSDPLKQSRAEQWFTLLVRHHSGRPSFQVLQELYATLTRRRSNFDRSKDPGLPASELPRIPAVYMGHGQLLRGVLPYRWLEVPA